MIKESKCTKSYEFTTGMKVLLKNEKNQQS